ncbi:hypothetical protein SLE2022_374230 [Rubroshorea leprosula]
MAAIAATDMSHDQSRWEFSCDFEVDFDSEENAFMIYGALVVDKAVINSCSQRKHFEAVEARFLRASFSAFVDILTSATTTVEELAPGMQLTLIPYYLLKFFKESSWVGSQVH